MTRALARCRWLAFAAFVCTLAWPTPSRGQSGRPWGRIAFHTQAARIAPDEGEARSSADFITSLAYHSAENDSDGLEFAFDGRIAGSSTEGRPTRVSLYNAWVGLKSLDGAWLLRGGHMWINELGGLGSIAGGLVEHRRRAGAARLRLAAFAGREPEAYDSGYVDNVLRAGGYVALDTGGLRRHVLGFVVVRDKGLTERSVVTTTNYVPVGKTLFVYQAAEYDLKGPAAQGDGGLTYFFANARGTPAPRVDLQATYHRGRSVDTRSITIDVLNGRPVDPRALDGLLFESATGRLTVEAVRGVRVYGSYGRDKNARDASPTHRTTAGGWASNLLDSGVDLTVTYSRNDRGEAGSYGSWYVSAGRNLSSRLYLSGDYTSSLSVLRFERTDGFTVETRPRTRRYAATALVTTTRTASFIVTLDRTVDEDVVDHRLYTGITYRIR